jgi:hypothetical protein
VIVVDLPRPPRKQLQAKDLSDASVLAAHEACRGRYGVPRWSTTWDIAEHLKPWPPKVVLAKLKSLRRRGLLKGLGDTMMDRGDWELP